MKTLIMLALLAGSALGQAKQCTYTSFEGNTSSITCPVISSDTHIHFTTEAEHQELLDRIAALEKRVKELETRTIRYLPEGVVCDGEGSNATCHDEYRKPRGKK